MMQNKFQWAQEYQVFASQRFQEGALVEAASNEQDIAYKQECTFDRHAIMQPPKSDPSGVDGSFKVLNDYETTNFAVATKVNGVFSVIYNTPSAIKGQIAFTPKNEVRVWFGLRSETNTMVTHITGNHIDVPFGALLEKSIYYTADGEWALI
ncbi:hypothetical protein GYMLUDRAFT_250869 [Collybiopsis luxurians FD-317 M1]|uniref:Uncharacterized protein n=1 Tax=Collybiopsis luxurians FD-317 M1 TaxID=944289 RepID=A0A0D0CD52_9AGAR|nr:hypothetical protein GYMLUDRAFT_250869 [Collybiopsis luxurians FD-317 M1]